MKRTRKLGALLLSVVVSVLFFSSCNKDDDNKVIFNATADVMIKAKKIGDAQKYAIELVVVGNKKIESVSVKTPGDNSQTIILTQGGSDNVFVKSAEDDDYLETMPEKGEYVFTIESIDETDEKLIMKDKLEDKKLDMVNIKESNFETNKLNIKWDLVSDTEAYLVRLYKGDKLLYQGSYLNKNAKEFSFGTSSNGWLSESQKAEQGNDYEIALYAFRFETDIKNYQLDHIQFISTTKNAIKWGE